MKKLLVLIALSVCARQLNAQTISIKLEYKAVPDSFYVSLVPSFTQGTFNLGPSQITIVFSNDYDISAPASAKIATTGVAGGAGWNAQDFSLETLAPNKRYVAFQTTGAPIPGGVSVNSPVLLFRFRVTGVGGNCIGLLRNYVNGPGPGSDLTDPSGEGGDFSTVVNEGGLTDYFSTNASTSLQSCAQFILPVTILEFNARRDNNNGVINWSATGEEFNSDYYQLERSIDGINFQPIARIDCRKLPGIQRYEYTDLNIKALNAKYVFYRLKQYDRDARFLLSSVRQLRFDIGEKGIQLYPNPVQSGFYVNIPFENPGQAKLSLVIMNSAGQPVQSREITEQQATNYYFDIKNVHLAAGDYYLRIISNGQVLDNKKFLISKD